jgi:hypothetical protein
MPQNMSRGPYGTPGDIDADNASLEDVTNYLEPPTVEEERIVQESRRIIDPYRGYLPSHVGILMEIGWTAEQSEWVFYELSSRVAVRNWVQQEQLDRLASQDVEML